MLFRSIPFKRQKIVYYELAITEKTNNLTEEQTALEQKARQLAQSKLPTDYTLLDESSSVSVVEDTMYASTTFTIIGVVN